MDKQINIEQALEWEVSKKGLIRSILHNNISWLHKRWFNKLQKQHNEYIKFKQEMQSEAAVDQVKQLINQ